MVYRGHVGNGVIRLDNVPTLPEGVEAEVRLLTEECAWRASREDSQRLRSAEMDFVGKAEGLPPDASINLDHYLYGLPKGQ